MDITSPTAFPIIGHFSNFRLFFLVLFLLLSMTGTAVSNLTHKPLLNICFPPSKIIFL